MENIILTREDLYNLVWQEPLSTLATKYSLSDNGFRKACKRMNIPIPINGYWQKVKFNKPVKKVPLPVDYIGDDSITIQERAENSNHHSDQSPLSLLTHQIQNDPKAPLTVPHKLVKPDPLIYSTQTYWALPEKDNYLQRDKFQILSINVEKKNRRRALLLMDTLIKLVRHRGHKVSVKGFETAAMIDEIKVPLYLREVTKRVPSTEKWRSADYIPTGAFAIKIGKYVGEKEWKDGRQKLEDQLAKIVAQMELTAQYEKEIMERARINNERYELERRQKENVARLKETELAKFNELLFSAERHNKAMMIRKYILKAQELEGSARTKEFSQWLSWAERKADWYDPLVNSIDDILGEYQTEPLKNRTRF